MNDLPDERDDAIAAALIAGKSLTTVRRQFGLSLDGLDEALSRLWPIDTQSRVRMIKRDVGKLEKLTQVFYEKALAGEVQAGLLTVKIYERLHDLLGMSAATRVDLQILTPPEQPPSSFDKIRAAILRVRGDIGDGAADVPSDSNGGEPSR